MSITYRTKENIIDAIDHNYAWRFKELKCIKKNIELMSGDAKNTAIRQASLLLYAHWEGFIKSASISYLQFIVDQKFRQEELTDNFRGIMLRKNYKNAESSHSIKAHIGAVKAITDGLTAYVIFDPNTQIKTDSNLNYKLFEDILHTLAIDPSPYETKQNQIDKQLLGRRNEIAHGEKSIPDQKSFFELFESVLSMINSFKTDLQNLCALERYKKSIG